MTLQMIDAAFDALQELYGSRSESTLAMRGLIDKLITRYEYRRLTGREATVGYVGLITDDSRGLDDYRARRLNCTCGDCRYCCGSGDEDDRTDEEKYGGYE